jgi:hypothetical protein
MSTTIRLGTTTYSFNDEYHSYDLSLESMFETIGSLSPKQGLEIIAPQCIRTYPEVSEEFERRFRYAVERYDLVPSAFGHYSDLGRIPGRDLSIEEAVEFSRIQLEGAKRLGYSLARMSYQSFDLTDRREALYRQLLPDLERLELKLAIEIHAPNIIESEQQQRVNRRRCRAQFALCRFYNRLRLHDEPRLASLRAQVSRAGCRPSHREARD